MFADWRCSFEDGNYCNMQQSSVDTIDWSIKEGPTLTSRTGPSQAYRGRKYALVEGSSRLRNDYAILQTATIPANSKFYRSKMACQRVSHNALFWNS